MRSGNALLLGWVAVLVAAELGWMPKSWLEPPWLILVAVSLLAVSVVAERRGNR